MATQSWFGKIWTRLRSGVVQDVPPNLEECETCREVDCTQERWLQCEKRLATEAVSLAASHAGTGKTDELPRVSAAGMLPAAAAAPADDAHGKTAGPKTSGE
jgi:hypothetical protein